MSIFIILVMSICTAFSLFHVLNSIKAVKEQPKKSFEKEKDFISILIPCYNEAGILNSTIKGIKEIIKQYPNSEFIFINDGSKDNTLNMLDQLLSLKITKMKKEGNLKYEKIKNTYQSTKYKNIYVIDKENGGKADSLNAGISYSTHELVVTLDADTILDKYSLDHINDAFKDNSVIAGGGNVNIIQGGQMNGNPLKFDMMLMIKMQIIEYLKGFMILKMSLARINALSVISGAFGIFRKDVLFEVGGYRNTVGEDIDITLKFHQYIFEHKDKKMIFLPHAISYTECPNNWKDLFNQRVRWQKAFIDCLVKYFKELNKTAFTRTVSFFFMFDSFLIGTIATSFTLCYLIYVLTIGISSNTVYIILIYLLFSVTVNLLNSFIGLYNAKKYGLVIRKEDRFKLAVVVLAELFIYRFIYMFFIMYGSIAYFIKKDGWNKVSRTGDEYFEEKTA